MNLDRWTRGLPLPLNPIETANAWLGPDSVFWADAKRKPYRPVATVQHLGRKCIVMHRDQSDAAWMRGLFRELGRHVAHQEALDHTGDELATKIGDRLMALGVAK